VSAAAPHPPATGTYGSGRGGTAQAAGPPADGVPAGGRPDRAPAAEACPLCGAPLAPEQDWCLRCGGAARTRLAASPRWTGPVVGVAVVALLALGVLAASLISLAGGSSTKTGPATTTVTIPAVTVTPTTAAPTGASGATSSTGATGTTSSTGASGATSSTGKSGATASTGATSTTGTTSRTGPSGTAAKPGLTVTTNTKSAFPPSVSKRLRKEDEERTRKAAG
jgi:hypothetical protein